MSHQRAVEGKAAVLISCCYEPKTPRQRVSPEGSSLVEPPKEMGKEAEESQYNLSGLDLDCPGHCFPPHPHPVSPRGIFEGRQAEQSY